MRKSHETRKVEGGLLKQVLEVVVGPYRTLQRPLFLFLFPFPSGRTHSLLPHYLLWTRPLPASTTAVGRTSAAPPPSRPNVFFHTLLSRSSPMGKVSPQVAVAILEVPHTSHPWTLPHWRKKKKKKGDPPCDRWWHYVFPFRLAHHSCRRWWSKTKKKEGCANGYVEEVGGWRSWSIKSGNVRQKSSWMVEERRRRSCHQKCPLLSFQRSRSHPHYSPRDEKRRYFDWDTMSVFLVGNVWRKKKKKPDEKWWWWCHHHYASHWLLLFHARFLLHARADEYWWND